jgi:hypothetical protein
MVSSVTWTAIALQRRREVAPRQENLPHAGLATWGECIGKALGISWDHENRYYMDVTINYM